jgi:hypothetical protein
MQEFISIYPIDKIIGNLFHIRVNAMLQKKYMNLAKNVSYIHTFGCHLVRCDDHIWMTLLPTQVMLTSIRDLKALQSNCVLSLQCDVKS